MLGGQGQPGAFAAQVEIGVAPAVEFTGATQVLARRSGVGVFAGMVDQHDGQVKLALELAEVRKQSGDLSGVVFIDAVESDQRIEDQEDGSECFNRVGQALTVGGNVQS